MKTISVNTPDGKVLDLTAPDGATADDIHQAVAGAIADYTKQQAAKQQTQSQQQPTSSPLATAVKAGISAAPGIGPAMSLSDQFAKLPPTAQKAIMTSIGAEAGLPAGAMASGAAAATMGGLTEAAQNPSTAVKTIAPIIKTALSSTPQSVSDTVANVSSPAAQDFLKRRAVEGATAAASGGMLKAIRGVTAEGPVTSTIENPSLVLKSTRDKILNELGMAKGAARVGEDAQEASRLRRMLAIGQVGKVKLAEEAVDKVSNNVPMSNTQLLAYEEALGKVQTKGGALSQDYAAARAAVRSQLKEQAPTLFAKKALARKVFLSEGDDKAPSLIAAVQHPITSTANFPGAQRVLGAATRIGSEALFPGFVSSADMLSSALQNLANARRGQ